MNLYSKLVQAAESGQKLLSVLVDPDKTNPDNCIRIAKDYGGLIDYFFVGSSLLIGDNFNDCIKALKENSSTPVVIFPGNNLQVSSKADAILLLSLISGRNPEMLIGKHVIAAPSLKNSGLEIIPTGYILIDCGHPTSVSYMSYTLPIPHDKADIAMCTALAGEQLGMKLIYMDAGSGARTTVSPSMVSKVKATINVPLIIGGGIKTPEKAADLFAAGADMIVIGNALEKDPSFIFDLKELSSR